MPMSVEQLGARVDDLGGRMVEVETRLRNVEQNMATKDDIQDVLSAITSLDAKVAGPVEVYSTTRSLGRFLGWAGTIIAALVGAILAIKEWWLR